MADRKPTIIDLYDGDDVTDFAAAKAAGVIGIIHKATEGQTVTMTQYAGRRQAAEKAGLLWGAYHFLRASRGTSVKGQVDNFLSVAKPTESTAIVLDWEAPEVPVEVAAEFLDRMDKITAKPCWLYSYTYFLLEHLPVNTVNRTLFASRPLYIADYRINNTAPGIHPFWKRWAIWQYTEVGKNIPGIKGNSQGFCDLNVFNGSDDELRLFWQGSGIINKTENTVPTTENTDPKIKPWLPAVPGWSDDRSRIAWIQKVLNKDLSVNPLLAIDGIVGPKTQSATKQFQSKYQLPTDGIVDLGGPTENKMIDLFTTENKS